MHSVSKRAMIEELERQLQVDKWYSTFIEKLHTDGVRRAISVDVYMVVVTGKV